MPKRNFNFGRFKKKNYAYQMNLESLPQFCKKKSTGKLWKTIRSDVYEILGSDTGICLCVKV